MQGIGWAFADPPAIEPFLALTDDTEAAHAAHAKAVANAMLEKRAANVG